MQVDKQVYLCGGCGKKVIVHDQPPSSLEGTHHWCRFSGRLTLLETLSRDEHGAYNA